MSLLHKSLAFRKRNLRAVVKEVKGRMEFVEESEGNSITDVRKYLENVMEARGEGLILKHPKSEYVLNGRNKDWVKVRTLVIDTTSYGRLTAVYRSSRSTWSVFNPHGN
jgi:DNA ligase-4